MLKLFDRSWIAMLMMSSVLVTPTPSFAQSVPDVIISEIAWAGSSLSHSDEWIELMNIGIEPIDISGWTLSGATSDDQIIIPDQTTLPSGGTYLISNYPHTHDNTALSTEPDLVTASVSLPNGGFHLHLRNHGGSTVDTAGGPGAPFAGQSGTTAEGNETFKSMNRILPATDGELETSWQEAQTSVNLSASASNLGTPNVALTMESENDTHSPPETPVSQETPTIRINEFMPNPFTDQPEWIELVNTSAEPVDLTDWTIEDATGTQTSLDGVLEPNTYYLIENPNGVLNNTGDEILVKDPTGDVITHVHYGTEQIPTTKSKGSSVAYTMQQTYTITYSPTPNTSNIINTTKPEPQAESEPADLEHNTTNEEDASFIDVIISEFVSDPNDGENEWIELHNRGTKSADLQGWTLEDERGGTTELSEYTLNNNSYLVIESPTGTLNNDGDTITLKDHTGAIVEQVIYGTADLPPARNGDALTRDADTFYLTQLQTPGTPNLVFIAREPEDVLTTDVSPPEEEVNTEPVSRPEQEPNPTTNESLITTLQFETLYPNTVGADEEQEYIELQNTGATALNLKDWMVQDASGKTYVLDDTMLSAGATHLIPRTESSIALNNSAEELFLFAPNSEQIDHVSYTKAKKGDLFTRTNAGWVWVNTQPTSTPVSQQASAPTKPANKQHTAKTQPTQETSIEHTKQQADGTPVSVTGTITAAAGTLGSQVLYLQDASGGIQVYLHSGNFRDLTEGTSVVINGEMSTSRQERRIKLSTPEDIRPSKETPAEIEPLSYQQTNPSLVGALVKTTGMVQSKTETKLILEEKGETTTIYLKSNPPIDPNQFMRGDTVTVTGILTQYNDQLRIRPRSQSDIHVAPNPNATTAGISVPTDNAPPTQRAGYTLLIGTLLALLAMAAWHYRPKQFLRPASI